MQAAGIICEFNPFHNGHKYLIDSVRLDINPDALVCVMSGNFVQRGEPSYWDKYTRAKMAVSCGADLVIELPVYYAVNNAAAFAKGGIEILDLLGCVSHYCFGSESGNIEELTQIAEKTAYEDRNFRAAVKKFSSEGMSYPKAYESALNERFSLDLTTDISAPNNILALEYIKSAVRRNSRMSAYTVQRTGAEHDSPFTDENSSSGSNIRSHIYGKTESEILENFYPVNIRSLMFDHFDCADAFDRYFSLIRYSVLRQSAYDLENVLEVSEGLENKIKKCIIEASDYDDLILGVKSKRYTYARISRILAQITLGITKKEFSECSKHPYARVLAFNEKGRELLKQLKSSACLPVITNLNKQDEITKEIPGLELDCFASSIYSIISNKTIYENSDMVCNSIPLNI